MPLHDIPYQKLLGEVIPVHLLNEPVRRLVEESIAEGGDERLWNAASLALETLCAGGFFVRSRAADGPDGTIVYHDRNSLLTIRLRPFAARRPDYEIPFRPILPAGFVSVERREILESVLTGIATRSSEDELGGALRKIADFLGGVIPGIAIRYLYLTEEEPPGGIFEPADSSPIGLHFRGHFISGGGPLSIADTRLDPRFAPLAPERETGSLAAFPLRVGDETIALLEASHEMPERFDDEELGVLSLLALLAAGRIRNAFHLEKLIYVDPLTGVFSRRFFEEQIVREVERANREQIPLTLVMVDLDNFKEVNDRFGHPAGDAVLTGVGTLLNDHVRKIDMVTRFGGEEFAILLPGADREQAVVICERLRSIVETLSVPESSSGLFRLTTSIGIALYPDHVGEGASGTDARRELLERADRALYHAKKSGKNRVVVWEESLG